MGCCNPRESGPGSRPTVPPTVKDACIWGCGYFNGAFQIIAAQLLIFIGFWFAMAALGDCAFVEVTKELDIPFFPNVVATQSLGLVTFDQPDGECYWYNEFQEIEDVEGQIRWYFDKLGDDWEVARAFAYTTPIIGFLLFVYSFSLCCSAQVRGLRYVMAFLLAVMMTIFQGLTFLVYGSDLCEEYDCEFARASSFSVVALCCWFVSGLCFLFMSDFPGETTVVQKSEGGVGDEEAPPAAIVPPPQEIAKSTPGEKDHDPNEEEEIDPGEPNESQTEPQTQEAVAEPEPAVDAEAEVIEVEATGEVVTDKADAAPLK